MQTGAGFRRNEEIRRKEVCVLSTVAGSANGREQLTGGSAMNRTHDRALKEFCTRSCQAYGISS